MWGKRWLGSKQRIRRARLGEERIGPFERWGRRVVYGQLHYGRRKAGIGRQHGGIECQLIVRVAHSHEEPPHSVFVTTRDNGDVGWFPRWVWFLACDLVDFVRSFPRGSLDLWFLHTRNLTQRGRITTHKVRVVVRFLVRRRWVSLETMVEQLLPEGRELAAVVLEQHMGVQSVFIPDGEVRSRRLPSNDRCILLF
ncbi:hypothetical protein H310_06107 [Aphanomyces invadans]|uniref:Uncharacterized protein n=1 Tax=Aphanomyces invadans TaxID=157072 RepID=A0A024UAI7_9STRA|nr:hypothetical protein H310_06107 [Aphanomyces invadans]ETW02648.1 hypothetical protein H310_06107 [Aphanomyces invadans]|eukprot:XP_008869253.1 hypothetical protein H310_06107 [Aphanomyces invadans]